MLGCDDAAAEGNWMPSLRGSFEGLTTAARLRFATSPSLILTRVELGHAT